MKSGLAFSFACFLAACGPGTPAGDADADATVADGAGDAVADSASDAADGGLDATSDAPQAQFSAMVQISQFSQNCMPIIANDPLTFTGSIIVSNTGGVTIGPITADHALIETEPPSPDAGATTFALSPFTIAAIAPGATGMAMISKLPNTLMPANGCSSVRCNSPVRIRIPIMGANVPPGTFASSPINAASCSM